MDSIGRKTNQSPDKVHVTGLQNVNNVLSHQITIFFTKPLGEKGGREGGGGREGEEGRERWSEGEVLQFLSYNYYSSL